MEYILGLVGIAIGAFGGVHWQRTQTKVGADKIRDKAETMLNEAKKEKAEIILEAKEKSLKIIDQSTNHCLRINIRCRFII